MQKSLRTKTIDSIKWTYISTVIGILLQIIYTGFMARILSPGLFGIVAMAWLFLSFGSYFSKMGLNEVLIQKKELTKNDIGFVFLMSVLIGFLFTVVFIVIAPLAGIFFRDVTIVNIICVLSISFLLDGFFSTPLSLTRRNLEFKFLAFVDVISFVIGYLVIGITMAYAGLGLWSLVIATLSQKLISGITVLINKRNYLTINFDFIHNISLLKLGSKFSFNSFLQFIGYYIIPFSLGRYLGAYELGLYNSSIRLSNMPIENLTNTLTRVLFPGFSQIQGEKERFKNGYLGGLLFVSIIIFPISFGMLASSENIVLAILGNKWVEAIPIFKILIIVAPFTILISLSGTVLDALANLKGKIIIEILYIFFQGLLIYLNREKGLMAFLYIYSITELIKVFTYLLFVNKVLKIKTKELLVVFKPVILITLFVSISIFIVSHLVSSIFYSQVFILIADIIVGILALLSSVFIVQDRFLNTELLKICQILIDSMKEKSNPAQYFILLIRKLMNGLNYA